MQIVIVEIYGSNCWLFLSGSKYFFHLIGYIVESSDEGSLCFFPRHLLDVSWQSEINEDQLIKCGTVHDVLAFYVLVNDVERMHCCHSIKKMLLLEGLLWYWLTFFHCKNRAVLKHEQIKGKISSDLWPNSYLGANRGQKVFLYSFFSWYFRKRQALDSKSLALDLSQIDRAILTFS